MRRLSSRHVLLQGLTLKINEEGTRLLTPLLLLLLLLLLLVLLLLLGCRLLPRQIRLRNWKQQLLLLQLMQQLQHLLPLLQVLLLLLLLLVLVLLLLLLLLLQVLLLLLLLLLLLQVVASFSCRRAPLLRRPQSRELQTTCSKQNHKP